MKMFGYFPFFLILILIKNAFAHPAAQSSTVPSLEYKPTRPFYHPNPGDYLSPIVPPGDPWPANLEGYANFSQTTSPKPENNLENRFKETTPKIRIEPTFNETEAPNVVDKEGIGNFSGISGNKTENSPVISLEDRIKETTTANSGRPSFHPNPGNYVGQIVPSGDPWPANLEGYANFSKTTVKPSRNKKSLENTEKSANDLHLDLIGPMNKTSENPEKAADGLLDNKSIGAIRNTSDNAKPENSEKSASGPLIEKVGAMKKTSDNGKTENSEKLFENPTTSTFNDTPFQFNNMLMGMDPDLTNLSPEDVDNFKQNPDLPEDYDEEDDDELEDSSEEDEALLEPHITEPISQDSSGDGKDQKSSKIKNPPADENKANNNGTFPNLKKAMQDKNPSNSSEKLQKTEKIAPGKAIGLLPSPSKVDLSQLEKTPLFPFGHGPFHHFAQHSAPFPSFQKRTFPMMKFLPVYAYFPMHHHHHHHLGYH